MPAQKETPLNVEMTSQALELLTCFQDEFSDAVAEVAESCARQRMNRTGYEAKKIEVTVEDVRCAANLILDAVKPLVAAGRVSASMAEAVRAMSECADPAAYR
jgi:hypothetical protein